MEEIVSKQKHKEINKVTFFFNVLFSSVLFYWSCCYFSIVQTGHCLSSCFFTVSDCNTRRWKIFLFQAGTSLILLLCSI